MQIPLIAQDKANHVTYGALIAAVSLSAQLLALQPLTRSALIAFGIVAAIGAVKELMDRRDPAHTPDVADFLATAAGGLLVVLPAALGSGL